MQNWLLLGKKLLQFTFFFLWLKIYQNSNIIKMRIDWYKLSSDKFQQCKIAHKIMRKRLLLGKMLFTVQFPLFPYCSPKHAKNFTELKPEFKYT